MKKFTLTFDLKSETALSVETARLASMTAIINNFEKDLIDTGFSIESWNLRKKRVVKKDN